MMERRSFSDKFEPKASAQSWRERGAQVKHCKPNLRLSKDKRCIHYCSQHDPYLAISCTHYPYLKFFSAFRSIFEPCLLSIGIFATSSIL